MLTFSKKISSFLSFGRASLSSDQSVPGFKPFKNTTSLLKHAYAKEMNAFGMIKNDLILLTHVRFLKKYFIKRYKALENERTYF